MHDGDLCLRGDRAPQRPRATTAVRMSPQTRRVRIANGVVAALLLWVVAGSLVSPTATGAPSGPTASIRAISQASQTGDRTVLQRYLDTEAVARSVYPAMIERMKEMPDYLALAHAVGETEADRILREEALREEAFVESFDGDLDASGWGIAGPLFAECSVASSEIDGDEAEVVLTGRDENHEIRYVVEMRLETVGGERLWRVKGITDPRGAAPGRTDGR
jgi:hypothetical protein